MYNCDLMGRLDCWGRPTNACVADGTDRACALCALTAAQSASVELATKAMQQYVFRGPVVLV
mgnify:CR=1 FL=1